MNYVQVSQHEEKGSTFQPQKTVGPSFVGGGRMQIIISTQRNYFRHSVYNLKDIIFHCIQNNRNQSLGESRKPRIHSVIHPWFHLQTPSVKLLNLGVRGERERNESS